VLKLTNIVHLTSVHTRYDVRIFLKECGSFAKNSSYHVKLIVADGLGNEELNGIKIFDVGKPKNRLMRLLSSSNKVYKMALRFNGDIYHFHDPELIPFGLKLKKKGKRVIYDIHEDVGKDILSKDWIPVSLRRLLAYLFEKYEESAVKKFDYVIAATPYIRSKFQAHSANLVDINNFPILEEFAVPPGDLAKGVKTVCYIGGITSARGVREIVHAMEKVKTGIRLLLGGKFSEEGLEAEVKTYPGWRKVDELGWLDREGVKGVLCSSTAGLVTLHPLKNYLDALPVKMFEYMAAGIPSIASDFPLWREIVEGNQCGICVDPLDPVAIGEAIQYLVDHPEEATQMGINGRKAVEEKFNWTIEEQKLLKVYAELNSRDQRSLGI
jgi:glycosyltransferase involved in cell wall biosynthesis